MLEVLKTYLDEKIADINKGKLPTTEARKKIDFHGIWKKNMSSC